MAKLLLISAFYKNDKPEGIGVSLTYEIGNLDTILSHLRDSWDQMWREAIYEENTVTLVNDLFTQLDGFGQRKGNLDIEASMLVIGNVYLLEKSGQLKGDEFNGLQLIYDNT